MKRSIITAVVVLGITFLFSSNTLAQEIKVGAGVGYGTEIESVAIEGGAVLGINKKFRAAADVKIFFPDSPNNVDNSFWEINVNGHYAFLNKANTTVYGLAGLNYAKQEVSGGGFTTSNSEIGLNLGGGAEIGLGFASLFGELKYALSDYDQLDISAGLRFGL